MTYTCKPKKVSIYINTKRKTATQVKKETGCDAVINGGLYNMTTFKPVCHLKADGKVLAADQYKYYGYAWNENDMKLTTEYGESDNFICCCAMVKDGKPLTMYYDSAVGRSTARTAIGTFADGRIWMYASKKAMKPKQLQDLALAVGVKDAIMLDGGGSTQGITPKGKVTSKRAVHNYICVWAE